jgi:hypothetical protein
MIQIVGLLVGVYILARCVAVATEGENGSVSQIGRGAYVLCFLVSAYLVYALLTATSPSPTP